MRRERDSTPTPRRKSGIPIRRAHPDDERIVLVTLTDEGEDRLRAYLAAALRLSPWVA
jgi:DNA-binding MarR family transcriptional regulator